MAAKNIKSIDRGYFEATCKDCGAVFIFAKGDDIFYEVDENRDMWPLCSQCYNGPRGNPSNLPRRDE